MSKKRAVMVAGLAIIVLASLWLAGFNIFTLSRVAIFSNTASPTSACASFPTSDVTRTVSILPELHIYGNLSVALPDVPSPLSIATDTDGTVFGVFATLNKTTYQYSYDLRKSADLFNWTIVNDKIPLPIGYRLRGSGRDFAITREGVIVIAATKMTASQNSTDLNTSTLFVASFDHGQSFIQVLNVSLRSKTGSHDGPGDGFWHGIAETKNGTLFAGLYGPQGLAYKSVDMGRSWVLAFNGTYQGHEPWHWVRELHDLEVDPIHDYVYVATDDESGGDYNASLWISTDYGKDWTLLYAQANGGLGLPRGFRVLTISFIIDGQSEYAVLGNDNGTKDLYFLQVGPSGHLTNATQVSWSSSDIDGSNVVWMSNLNQSDVLVLTWVQVGIHVPSRAGLFQLSIVSGRGVLKTILSVDGNGINANWSAFWSGTVSGSRYGVIVQSNAHFYLVVFPYRSCPNG